ncbi:MAG: Holliday junction branch migration protein RuvA [Proteobacteria bacterium]|nr:Holliday junction branch migration protein RuvA [Pseudomonadota bacterium]MCP4917581.1 Holliday junction branch migration protein RuvA [Pseudomonadota bacterium]
MIARLVGEVVEVTTGALILDVSGVGYLVRVGPRHGSVIVLGDVVTLSISTQVREDAITLYGFRKSDDRALFEQLMSVSGVGPKLALALCDGLGIAGLATAVHTEDTRALLAVPGVGKKTAQRLVLEMKGRIERNFSPTSPTITPPPGNPPSSKDPLRLALARLGYRKTEIDGAVRGITDAGLADKPLAERLSAALRVLSGGRA